MSYTVRLYYKIRSKKSYIYLITVGICILLLGYIVIAYNLLKYEETEEREPLENSLHLKIHEHMAIKSSIKQIEDDTNSSQVSYNVHVFYYAWYANPEIDGEYRHWNHAYIKTWKKNDNNNYPEGHHHPPDDIGSNYYPKLGCYSSNDVNIMNTHMKMLHDAGVGVIVLSWRPLHHIDSPSDIFLDIFFDTASFYSLKVALHVEPYEDRNPKNLQGHLKSFFKKFGNHSALYKIKKQFESKELPVVYLYDSYLISSAEWKEMFSYTGKLSIRNTEIDGIYLGLLSDIQHRDHIKNSQFDGFYTYFASNGFTYGSSWKNWKNLARFAFDNKLIFIPSIGPGYVDTKVRPWNSENIRDRKHGHYYDMSWKNAMDNHVKYISITSFNEWHEGTQIEPAIAKAPSQFQYYDYEPEGPYFYMNLTRKWVVKFNATHSFKQTLGH